MRPTLRQCGSKNGQGDRCRQNTRRDSPFCFHHRKRTVVHFEDARPPAKAPKKAVKSG